MPQNPSDPDSQQWTAPSVCITPTTPSDQEAAEQLSRELDLPIYQHTAVDQAQTEAPGFRELAKMLAEADFQMALILSEEGLGLFASKDPPLGPVFADYGSKDFNRRLQQPPTRNEPLGRALGLHRMANDQNLRVLDGTAGWGRDMLAMAGLGCQVVAVERNPIVACLLKHAHHRLLEDSNGTDEEGASIEILHQPIEETLMGPISDTGFDCIYLDPMAPASTSTAKPRRDMELLQTLLGPQDNGEELLQIALKASTRRVVVKRPHKSPFLGDMTPRSSVKTDRMRFDIYPGALE